MPGSHEITHEKTSEADRACRFPRCHDRMKKMFQGSETVPMNSVCLKPMTAEMHHAFYREYQNILNSGHWRIESRNGCNVFAECSNENGTVIILADEIFAEKAMQNCRGKIAVLNLSGNSFTAEGTVFDSQGNLLENNIVPPGGRVVRQ